MRYADKSIPRRALLLGALTTSLMTAVSAQAVPEHNEDLTAPDAHKLAVSGKITLVDIRTPYEWAETGSGQGAHRLDMRRDDFLRQLVHLVGGDPKRVVAIICAHGHRSLRMSRALRNAGFERISDVPEGMAGSRAGPGWIARKLPLVRV